MATGIFAILDDVAMLLDDAAAMSKIATKKTATLLSDDLAVNAQKASGFASSRELPVLWAITKGSFFNKIVILPVAFLLSAFASWVIVPILMIGGLYLAYEGAEKVFEYLFHRGHEKQKEILSEAQKIKSAILTDFILSIEIVIIALNTVTDKGLILQITVVTVVAIIATIGVYGIVALLVRMDDVGFKLIEISKGSKLLAGMGKGLVLGLPRVIQLLSVIGTIAMLLVAGGIYVHNIHTLHEWLEFMPSILAELLTGSIVGVIVLAVVKLITKLVMMIRN